MEKCQKLKMMTRASYHCELVPYIEGSDIPLSRRPCFGGHLTYWPKNDYNKGRSGEHTEEGSGCSRQIVVDHLCSTVKVNEYYVFICRFCKVPLRRGHVCFLPQPSDHDDNPVSHQPLPGTQPELSNFQERVSFGNVTALLYDMQWCPTYDE